MLKTFFSFSSFKILTRTLNLGDLLFRNWGDASFGSLNFSGRGGRKHNHQFKIYVKGLLPPRDLILRRWGKDQCSGVSVLITAWEVVFSGDLWVCVLGAWLCLSFLGMLGSCVEGRKAGRQAGKTKRVLALRGHCQAQRQKMAPSCCFWMSWLSSLLFVICLNCIFWRGGCLSFRLFDPLPF